MARRNPFCGVYVIECKVLNKAYVGSSVDVVNRFAQHKNVFKNNRCENKEFQEDWNKYGINAFEFKKLEEAYRNDLRKEETEKCKLYLENGWQLYNRLINIETNIINVPKEYIPIIKKVIKHLELGNISVSQIDQQLL